MYKYQVHVHTVHTYLRTHAFSHGQLRNPSSHASPRLDWNRKEPCSSMGVSGWSRIIADWRSSFSFPLQAEIPASIPSDFAPFLPPPTSFPVLPTFLTVLLLLPPSSAHFLCGRPPCRESEDGPNMFAQRRNGKAASDWPLGLQPRWRVTTPPLLGIYSGVLFISCVRRAWFSHTSCPCAANLAIPFIPISLLPRAVQNSDSPGARWRTRGTALDPCQMVAMMLTMRPTASSLPSSRYPGLAFGCPYSWTRLAWRWPPPTARFKRPPRKSLSSPWCWSKWVWPWTIPKWPPRPTH